MAARLILLMIILVGTSCFAQTKISNNDAALIKLGLLYQAPMSSTFSEFIKLFPKREFPLKYKNDIPSSKTALINKQDAIKYLRFIEENLKMNDYQYNYDDDIKIDRWVETLPAVGFKIQQEKYVALTYSLLKLPEIEMETYNVWLTTFSYQGNFIDSIIIRSQYTREFDWKDVVFLNNSTFKIFQYSLNKDNYNIKYEIIDEKQPLTVVEIDDYQIDENGTIIHVKTHPKQYLKEFVSFYREYHKDSDDPMNEYDYEKS